jgi:isopenicillin-N N-acyltransferase like protein
MHASRTVRLLAYFLVAFALAHAATPAPAQTVARCGEGWLELIDGYPVLHLKGTHYEMGYQHGALMKESIEQNLRNILEAKMGRELVTIGGIPLRPRHMVSAIVKIQEKHVPQKYFDELRGLADGSGLPLEDARVANFLPELFHCSGFAIMDSATKDGTLYHGRVLDYAIDWGLQEHPVIIVAEPEGGVPFVNVSYAGFIGSVTGMNARHVSIGEMGGGGLGAWDGVPMAFLVREVLETADDLDAAVAVFRDNPRTCQYFYVIADAKTNRAVGMEASADRFEVIEPGQHHPLLPRPVQDCVLLSAGDRYEELARRVKAGHGTFTAETALRLMDRPVAMSSNLHNVLFEPNTTRFRVANASPDRRPAAEQKYHKFQLSELLQRRPDASSREIPLPERESDRGR